MHPDLASIADRFAHGECAAFAIACMSAYAHQGWRLVIFRDDDTPQHAACQVADNLYFDAYGFVTASEIDRYPSKLQPGYATIEQITDIFGLDEGQMTEAREHLSIMVGLLSLEGQATLKDDALYPPKDKVEKANSLSTGPDSTRNLTHWKFKQLVHALVQIPNNIPSVDFDDGACGDVAIAAFNVAEKMLLDPSFTIIFRTESDGDGFEATCLSHIVLTVGSECIDIGGAQADERWCERWSTRSGYRDEDNLESSFEFVDISTQAQLMQACAKHQVEMNVTQQAAITDHLTRHIKVQSVSAELGKQSTEYKRPRLL